MKHGCSWKNKSWTNSIQQTPTKSSEGNSSGWIKMITGGKTRVQGKKTIAIDKLNIWVNIKDCLKQNW